MKHIAHALTRISAVFALVVPLSAGTTGLLSTIPAEAQTATGSLSFVSDPGDYIGNGQSATYSTSSGDRFTVANLSGLNQGLDVSVSASNTNWWELILAAPAGQALVPGT